MEMYNGFLLYRTWLEQARYFCTTDTQLGELLVALCDYAIYDKKYKGKDKMIKGFLLGCTKSLVTQRKRYKVLCNSPDYNKNKNKNKNMNMSNNMTSDKDEEEEIERLLERINKKKL